MATVPGAQQRPRCQVGTKERGRDPGEGAEQQDVRGQVAPVVVVDRERDERHQGPPHERDARHTGPPGRGGQQRETDRGAEQEHDQDGDHDRAASERIDRGCSPRGSPWFADRLEFERGDHSHSAEPEHREPAEQAAGDGEPRAA